jgi:isocitrate dehydrogenase
MAVFEATHGTAPKYANQDRVNPGSVLLSGVMMLDYIGWTEAAEAITGAYTQTVADRIVCYDFARQMEDAHEVRTSEFASAVIDRL